MKPDVFPTIIAAACLAAGASTAAPRRAEGESFARLTTPVAASVEKLIDGRFWRCSDDTCVAQPQDGADSQPLWMECSHAAAEFGAFTEYSTGRSTLEPAKLQRCNAHAKGADHG